MKKILFFCIKFPLASETFVLNQIISFINKGYEVEILSLYPGDLKNLHEDFHSYNISSLTNYIFPEDLPGNTKLLLLRDRVQLLLNGLARLNIHSFNFSRYGFLSYSLLLPAITTRIRKKYSADIIVAHFGHCGVVANYLRDLGIISGKLVTVFHGYDLSAKNLLIKYKNDYDKLFSSGDFFLPISNLWKNKLIQMGCPEDKISVVRMGIKTKDFIFHKREVDVDSIKIITVCRLTEKKDSSMQLKHAGNLKIRVINSPIR